MFQSIINRSIILVGLLGSLSAEIIDSIKICAIRVSFNEDDLVSTTGSGDFLLESEGIDCGSYTIDPAPHDKDYFESQIMALNSYFRSVSYEKFGINMEGSVVFPFSQNGSYKLSNTMNYYNPYIENDVQERRITELFQESIITAYQEDSINFSSFDLVVVFHAGIGQDFSLPFLDPTPEDIPSTYIDQKMISDNLNQAGIIIGEHIIDRGIILPESQNHLLFDIAESMFGDATDPCEYQYGLTGTFALMVGFAIGLPPLWNIESGESRVGVFGLMDQGSNNGRGIIPSPPTAWSRIYAGWEAPVEPDFNSEMYLPLRNDGNIIKIPITDQEYYLIENRSNHVRPRVSIDSIRYLIGTMSNSGTYPSYSEILQDSSGIEKDINGVVVSVPNYDIGLPASGLLIWHIDDAIISSSIDGYGINHDIQSMGIDLEEADGAQDIGHQSIFLFNDPSSGYFGDMWFRGNTQYVLANPSYEGLKPEFGPFTYPSTQSNNGANSYIKIEEISIARDTMRLVISNQLIADGYPQENLDIKAFYDIDRDGTNEVFGRIDSLSVWETSDPYSKQSFHPILSEKLFISFIEKDEYTVIEIVENFINSSLHSTYHYDLSLESFSFQNQFDVDSLVFPVIDEQNNTLELKGEYAWNIHSKRIFSNTHSFSIDLGLSGITVEKFGEIEKKWDSKFFNYISGIDLDLDKNMEALSIDSVGNLYGFNSDLILMAGFPFEKKVFPPVLSNDIDGNEFPEIIVRSFDRSSLYIFDSKGVLIDEIALNKRDSLIGTGNYNGKKAIYTSTTVYQFDSITSNPYSNNSWSSFNGNLNNTRKLDLDYEFINQEQSIINRSYCYPNPIRNGSGIIRIETNSGEKVELMLYDLAGFYIDSYSSNIEGLGNQISEWRWDTKDVESGVYFANVVVSGKNKTESALIKIAVID